MGRVLCRVCSRKVSLLLDKFRDISRKVIPSNALLLDHLAHSLPQSTGKRWQGSLHPNLDALKRTQRNIRQELRTGTRTQKHHRLVHVGEEFLSIQILEHFVESVLSSSLQRVAHERGRPAEENPAEPFTFVNLGPGLEIGFIKRRIDLPTGFHEIEGCDGRVGWAAGCARGLAWQYANERGAEPEIPPMPHARKYFPL